jgi:hypothetical protein
MLVEDCDELGSRGAHPPETHHNVIIQTKNLLNLFVMNGGRRGCILSRPLKAVAPYE